MTRLMKEQREGRRGSRAGSENRDERKIIFNKKANYFNYLEPYRPAYIRRPSRRGRYTRERYLFGLVSRGKSFNREFARVARESASPFLHRRAA